MICVSKQAGWNGVHKGEDDGAEAGHVWQQRRQDDAHRAGHLQVRHLGHHARRVAARRHLDRDLDVGVARQPERRLQSRQGTTSGFSPQESTFQPQSKAIRWRTSSSTWSSPSFSTHTSSMLMGRSPNVRRLK